MRFLHTADWHLGKNLCGYSLLDEQHLAFQQIETIAKQEQVDAIVISGDLYDRKIPSEAAVKELNAELRQLNLSDQLPVLAISGNHDSATRLATGSDWYKTTNLYLSTTVEMALRPITVGDTQFFLLPYFELQEVRNYFNSQNLRTTNQAMDQLVREMKKLFQPDYHHVLVAHFFAAGSSHTDSETQVEVGGLNAVSVDILNDFDYVALGHLHNHNALLSKERIRYAGSPLKLSPSEIRVNKGVWIVNTSPFKLKWIPIEPEHDIIKLTGSFQNLTTSEISTKYNPDNFFVIELTDQGIIPDVMERLRKYYPKIIQLTRQQGPVTLDQKSQVDLNLDPLAMLKNFYQFVNDNQLTHQQEEQAKKALHKVEKEEF